MASRTKKTLVAEICLYGAVGHGHGYIARVADGRMFGDGELRGSWGCTDAMWHALRDIRELAATRGIVRVYMPGGLRMAEVKLECDWPAFGDLKWTVAPQYEIPIAQLIAVAEHNTLVRT